MTETTDIYRVNFDRQFNAPGIDGFKGTISSTEAGVKHLCHDDFMVYVTTDKAGVTRKFSVPLLRVLTIEYPPVGAEKKKP